MIHKTIPYLPSCCMGSVYGQCLCLQISDYEYRDPSSHLWAPAVSYHTATVITFHPSVCFLQEKTAIDSATYRALHVVCIHNRVSPPMVLMSSYKALITCLATP